MKLSAKSMSSPGRVEKYPPPLMRFLRSNVGSRSRGRSRLSPMFVRKKNTAIESQEPSSPKVTCMGQVRVKRSGKKPSRPGVPTRTRSNCKWISNTLFCHHFPEKVKPNPSFRHTCKKWGAYFHIGSCRKLKIREDTSKLENKIESSVEENGEDEESEEEIKEAKIFASSSRSSPPKNALSLTRCRSAPYRSSSLAYRFWGSPLANNDEETEQENREFKVEEEDEEKPTSEKELIRRNSDQSSKLDSETEKKTIFCKGFDEKNTEKSDDRENLKTEQFENVRPLILTRCKSEPREQLKVSILS